MKLREILESGLIQDKDEVELVRLLGPSGKYKQNGTWYEDRMLTHMDDEVLKITFDAEEGWSITTEPL